MTIHYRSTGGAYVAAADGRQLVGLECVNCRNVMYVDVDWRREHIGETVMCWDCRRWADIPVLAQWERH